VIAAIYTRVSTSAQEEDGASLEGQLEDCLKRANELGYVVPEHLRFTDTYSGAYFEERKGLQSLIAAMRRNEFDAVIAWSQDRISRDQTHMSLFVYVLDQAKAKLVLVKGEFDRSTQGQFMQSVYAFMSQTEREKIRDRTMMGKEQRVKNGTPLGASYPPYGYEWETDAQGKKTKLVINDDQAEALRWIMRQVLVEGRSLTKIAFDLNTKMKVPTAKGGLWTSSNLSKMLSKGVYVGKYEAFNRSKTRDVVIIDVPAIFTEEEQQAFIEAIGRNQKFSPRKLSQETLLRSYLFCHCGAGMGLTSRSGLPIYQCNNAERHSVDGTWRGKVGANKIDNAVWSVIASTLTDREKLQEARERGASEDPTKLERETIERVIKEKERQEKNGLDSILSTDDAELRSMLMERVKMIRGDLQGLREELAKHQQRYEAWSAEQSNLMALDDFIENVAHVLSSELTMEKKRALLHALQVKVVVKQGERFPRAELSWVAQDGAVAVPMGYKSRPVTVNYANNTCSGGTPP
jgi:site-specific DNA recombinase